MSLPYVYLSYYGPQQVEKMDYKVRFSPTIELLKPKGWTLVVGGAQPRPERVLSRPRAPGTSAPAWDAS